MSENKRKRDSYYNEQQASTQNSFINDIQKCVDTSQIICRIAMEPRFEFTREEMLEVVRRIENIKKDLDDNSYSYLI